MRLFVEKVYNGSYFNRDENEVVLYVNATLPNGSTLEQMNTLVKRMETYLTEFKEIRQFQTSIYNARRAGIQIYFKDEYSHTGFPYTLKANIISKALTEHHQQGTDLGRWKLERVRLAGPRFQQRCARVGRKFPCQNVRLQL